MTSATTDSKVFADSVATSHTTALELLDTILKDFGLRREPHGSCIKFVGGIPGMHGTKSENINLTLLGTVPALANAIAATQIYEARGGKAQTIEVDLRKGHNYLDPDTGMTPTVNGQVWRQACCKEMAVRLADPLHFRRPHLTSWLAILS